MGEAIKKHFEGFGGTITQLEVFVPGEADFKIQLNKIKASNPEALLIAGEPKEAGLIIKQMKELDIKSKVLIHSAAKGPEIYNIADEAANGLIVLNTFDKTKKETANYMEEYRQKYDEEAEFVSALAYDATKIIIAMIRKCGLDTDCIKHNLYQIKDYAGASSSLTFDKNGDVNQPFIIEIYQNGQFVPYEE